MHYGYDYKIDTRVISGGKGPSINLLAGLTSYWRMDEGSGANRADLVGTNTLVNNGTVGVAAGLISTNAASFPGTVTDYLLCANNATLGSSTECALSLWVYVTAWPNADNWIMSKGNFTFPDQNYGLYNRSDSRIVAPAWDGSGNPSVFANRALPTVNAWHHFIIGYRPFSSYIYLDNGTETTSAGLFGPSTTTQPLVYGCRSDLFAGSGLACRVCEVGWWRSRILNPSERAYLYNSGAGRTYPF